MRKSLVCFSSLNILAASILAGCSSDNSPAVDSGADVTTASDAQGEDVLAEGSTDSGVTGSQDSAGCMPIDASVATLAGGPVWACYESACASQLSACAADCVCNRAFLAALLCSGDGGSSTMCFGQAIRSGSPAVVPALGCLAMNTTCMPTDGGAEAGQDGSVNGGADGGAEGGADGGAADGAAESGADTAATDSASAG